MAKQYLRVTFYSREGSVNVAIGEQDSQDMLAALKGLAAGGRKIQAFYLFPISADLSALIGVHEIQTVQFSAKPNGDDWRPPVLKHGVAFYMKGRREPIELDYSGAGPLDDMFRGLTDTGYDEELPGCVMLADGAGEPTFLRLDEIQYAVVRTPLVQKPS